MANDFDKIIKDRIERIRRLTEPGNASVQYFEAGGLALTVLHDTVGGSHPLAGVLDKALRDRDWPVTLGATRSVIALVEQGGLTNPRLAIAHEIEGSLLDLALAQAQAAESNNDPGQKQLQLAIAAFLAGAALEDALRRLCDAHTVSYDVARTTIAKLQAALYQPSKGIEHISNSENKQITAWADTRNKADHGKFSELTQTEVIAIVMGTRAFIDKHLP